ncbi:MAG TPA: glutathione S-transferase family protein [Steroidobacteraceae bacterium]|nr:glutathione S-transferase family protein [Steroidobacteraceae bacterium]
MILLGASISPFVRKVLVMAAEKQIPLEHRQLSPTTSQDPLFLAASPFRKIPVLIDGDYHLADSTAIVAYLEARFPQTPMFPADPRERGTATWYEEVADTIMFPAGQKIFFNRVVLPRFLNRPGDLATAAEAQATLLPPVYDYLEKVVPVEGFLVGGSLSIADICVTSMLVNMHFCDAGVDPALHPRLAAYFARISARPSFAGLIAGDRAMLAA